MIMIKNNKFQTLQNLYLVVTISDAYARDFRFKSWCDDQ